MTAGVRHGLAPALRLDRVSKRFGRRTILDDVSLSIAQGAVCVIRGANGSGKTTILRLAAGLTRPSGGTVVASVSRAYVPATVVMPRRTPLRVLLDGLNAMTGVAVPLGDALEMLGCAQYLDAQADTLSTGTAMKSLIAQALSSRAELVVLDEPAAHLDDDAVAGFARLVDAARARGAAVLTAGASGSLPGAEIAEIAEIAELSAGRLD